MIPKDPVILLSFINTKLRDEYASLSELCAALDADAGDISGALAAMLDLGHGSGPMNHAFDLRSEYGQ